MPHKDIKKRREAYMRWANKNKEKRREYQRILWIAKKANPVPKKCFIIGCNNIGERHHPDYSRPEEVVWICRTHHRKVKHGGKCKICGEKISGRGLCNKHYKRERKKTDKTYAEKCKEWSRHK